MKMRLLGSEVIQIANQKLFTQLWAQPRDRFETSACLKKALKRMVDRIMGEKVMSLSTNFSPNLSQTFFLC
jgi:hypothetical protein